MTINDVLEAADRAIDEIENGNGSSGDESSALPFGVPTPKTGENKSFAHYFEEEIAGIFESAKNELPSTNSDKMERLVQGRISEILEELKSISTVEAKVAAANKDFDEAKKSSRNRLNKYLKQLRAFIDAGKPTEKPAPRTRKTLPKPVAKVVKRKPAKAKAKA